MMKRLLSLLLAAAAVPAFCCTAGAAPQGPADVTLAFYGRYVRAGEQVDLKKFKELDKCLVDKIDAMVRKAAKENPEMGGLDFDAIVWGQEAPDKFVTVSESVNGGDALVTVGKSWPDEKDPSSLICVSLKKKSGAWKIIDTVDPELFEKKDCASFRPGAMFPPLPE